jgi:hypothetical protein
VFQLPRRFIDITEYTPENPQSPSSPATSSTSTGDSLGVTLLINTASTSTFSAKYDSDNDSYDARSKLDLKDIMEEISAEFQIGEEYGVGGDICYR